MPSSLCRRRLLHVAAADRISGFGERVLPGTVEPIRGLIENYEKTTKDITMQKAEQDLVSLQFWCA